MATASNVLKFSGHSKENLDVTPVDTISSKPIARVIRDKGENKGADQSEVSIEDLYPASDTFTSELSIALGLLSKNIQRVDVAIKELQNNDLIEADSAMQQVHATLPELFNCRGLGDGYAEVINALLGAFENRSGVPFDKRQVITIRQVLSHLRSEPFMKFNTALDLVEKLESVSLVVEPKGLEYLLDWLDE